MSNFAALMLTVAILALAAAMYFGPIDRQRWAERRSRVVANLRAVWARWKKRVLWSVGGLVVVVLVRGGYVFYEEAIFDKERRQQSAIRVAAKKERLARTKERPAFQACLDKALLEKIARRPERYENPYILLDAQEEAEQKCLLTWRRYAIQQKTADLLLADDIDLESLEIIERARARVHYRERARRELQESGDIE